MKILIADDHEIVREGLTRLINKQMDMIVVGYAENGLDALFQIKSLNPEIVIMDTGMPVLSGIDAIPLIHEASPETKIILFSINTSDEYIDKSFNSGAMGYVLKLSSSHDILDSIHAAARGEYFVSPLVNKRIIDKYMSPLPSPDADCRYDLLTNIEQHVFRQIVEGFSIQEIATMTACTPPQIMALRQSISLKLQRHDLNDMIAYAEHIGIIMPKCWNDHCLSQVQSSHI